MGTQTRNLIKTMEKVFDNKINRQAYNNQELDVSKKRVFL